MYWVYILYSEKIDKYYIGATSNLKNRFDFHNSDYNKIWTKRGKPWKLVFSHKFETHKDAFGAERFIKKQKSRVFITKLITEGWK
jgi:putative endonuclease